MNRVGLQHACSLHCTGTAPALHLAAHRAGLTAGSRTVGLRSKGWLLLVVLSRRPFQFPWFPRCPDDAKPTPSKEVLLEQLQAGP